LRPRPVSLIPQAYASTAEKVTTSVEGGFNDDIFEKDLSSSDDENSPPRVVAVADENGGMLPLAYYPWRLDGTAHRPRLARGCRGWCSCRHSSRAGSQETCAMGASQKTDCGTGHGSTASTRRAMYTS